jgi:hypothetical protein
MFHRTVLETSDNGFDDIVTPWLFHPRLDSFFIKFAHDGTYARALFPKTLDQLKCGVFFGVFNDLALEIAKSKRRPCIHLPMALTPPLKRNWVLRTEILFVFLEALPDGMPFQSGLGFNVTD